MEESLLEVDNFILNNKLEVDKNLSLDSEVTIEKQNSFVVNDIFR